MTDTASPESLKILVVSDRIVKAIYSPQLRELHCDAELVLSCGDLPYYYLEYIVTMLPIPLLYVYGNHDKTQYMSDGRTVTKPEGCVDIDGRVVRERGLLIAGLGGSMRYHPGAINQYTEGEMRARILRLIPRLLLNKVFYGRYLDILVTHSPPLGIHDGQDLPHTGFKSLLTLMRYFRPRYMLHGHKHVYRNDSITASQYHRTSVVNVYPSRVIQWEYNTPKR